jgi:alkylated DNA repair protein alkB homolog 7
MTFLSETVMTHLALELDTILVAPSSHHIRLKSIKIYFVYSLRYERDHWDDAIQGFRETERKQWYPQNKEIINKVITRAFPNSSQTLPHIHILDLEATGFIKPHVDSVRYCGTTIAGISLLSDSIMKLVQTTEDHSAASDDYRNQPTPSEEEKKNLYSVKILLKRHSLYIMSHSARYNFTHEILKNEESFLKNQKIVKNRRISIICRNEP